MKRLYFKTDSEVITEGDFGDCAYIVESGRLEVSKANKQNNKTSENNNNRESLVILINT